MKHKLVTYMGSGGKWRATLIIMSVETQKKKQLIYFATWVLGAELVKQIINIHQVLFHVRTCW